MKAYLVTVETTDVLGTSTYGKDETEYKECDHRQLIVVTDNPKKIYENFIMTREIKEIGIGYNL